MSVPLGSYCSLPFFNKNSIKITIVKNRLLTRMEAKLGFDGGKIEDFDKNKRN